MRIAIISDVHGNYPALMAVVEDALSNNVDEFIFTGDYIFNLPFSNEIAQLIMKLENTHIIKGNKELYLAKLANDSQENSVYNQMGGKQFIYRELSVDAFNFLNALEEEIYIQLNSGIMIYANHIPKFPVPLYKTNFGSYNFYKKMLAEPFSHEQYLTEFGKFINKEDNKNFFNQINANVIIFGHNHLQSFAYLDDKLIINPGSCGLPFDFNPAAAYTILEVTTDGFNVIEKRVDYDIENTINNVKQSTFYENEKIWCDIAFCSLKTGKDYLYGVFLEIVGQIASSKNEEGDWMTCSDAVWAEAGERFIAEYRVDFLRSPTAE